MDFATLRKLILADKQSLCLVCIAFYLPPDITFSCAILVCSLAKIRSVEIAALIAYVTNK